ncbi:sirohydrochlorin chelatase [Alicyclobacillus macrosporangiidus]|uniref:Precorrin-8X/cobalt-precorrin-8 methylmutase n=1 Tax=Alicyclobacillus macrosporangiidus TaxID=392015 RepID=A0A1I7HED1_9BACL|nr:CbiX/SirB N-terminal domain-containing protein [Alicyclobacillus macrosporangiidus]SFU59057.1 precorrin-8X/cobalt-precorrin-8 methylmutase [Alicyclobacillus macrosporangiidus]
MTARMDRRRARTGALLFVGHGTRSDAGTGMFLRTVRQAAERLPAAVARSAVVETAYLELRDPGVPTALAALYARGIRQVALIPALLFAAGHWKTDLPAQVEAFTRTHPDAEVCLGPVLGEDHRLAALAAERCRTAGGIAPGDALLVVGRGNRDVEAHEAFLRTAAVIGQMCGAERFAAGVLAGDGTPVELAARRLAAERPNRVVVVPYLLFDGYLMRTLPDRLRAAWDAGADGASKGGGPQSPARTSVVGAGGPPDGAPAWVVAPPLGPDPVVSEVLAERAVTAWACLTVGDGRSAYRGALRSGGRPYPSPNLTRKPANRSC